MSTIYNGLPGNESLHALIAIKSSTDATPIVIETNVAHDYTEGDEVVVRDHAVNVTANGIWQVHIVDATHVSLYAKITSAGLFSPSVGAGAGAGGLTGTIRGTGLFPTFTLPADGENPTAASVGGPLEDAGDRSQYIMSKMGLYRVVWESTRVVNALASAAADNTYGTGVAQDTTWKKQGLAGPLSLDFFPSTFPDVHGSDIVECEFKTQAEASVSATLFAIGVEFFDPGAGPTVAVNGACTKVDGSTTLLQFNSSADAAADGNNRDNLVIRAKFFPLFGGSDNLSKKMALYVAARTVAGINSGYAFDDDLQWTVRILRNTSLVV